MNTPKNRLDSRSCGRRRGALLLPAAASAADWKPTKPVEFVVPSGAGGGTDQFARMVQSIIVKHKLMDQSIIVTNKGGGAGAEGFVDVASAKGDPHKVMFGTNNAYLLPLVLKVPLPVLAADAGRDDGARRVPDLGAGRFAVRRRRRPTSTRSRPTRPSTSWAARSPRTPTRRSTS